MGEWGGGAHQHHETRQYTAVYKNYRNVTTVRQDFFCNCYTQKITQLKIVSINRKLKKARLCILKKTPIIPINRLDGINKSQSD